MIYKILKKLVSFKTITKNHKENRKALDWIKKQLPFQLKGKIETINGFPAMYVSTKNTLSPKILLAGHLDVVEAQSSQFQVFEKNGKLYGRGVCDMKFAIASYISVLNSLSSQLLNLDIGLLITTDEEIGGNNGTKVFVERGLKPKVVFLPDGGENWQFQEKTKGCWWCKIEAKGKSAHGAHPWEGDNALEKIIFFLKELRKKFPKEPCNQSNHFHPTLNIGKMIAGEVANKVPDFAEALIDIRFPSKKDFQEIKKIIGQMIKKYPGLKIQTIAFADPYKIEKSNPYLVLFSKIAKNFGILTSFTIDHGSTDARFFTAKKIPVLIISPKSGGAHSNTEWIDKNDIETFTTILESFILMIQEKSDFNHLIIK